ncbi:MAG: hypothetical protein ACYC0F_18080 [Rhodanobacter sp.]
MRFYYALVLLLFVPIATAQYAPTSSGDGHKEYYMDTFAVAGVSTAGNMRVSVDYPTWVLTATDTFAIAGTIEGPDTVTGVAASYSWLLEDLVGCTSGGLSLSSFSTIGNMGNVKTVLTMTSNFCRGTLRVDPTINAVAVARFRMPFYIRVLPTTLTVADDSGGWAVHQDQACGATVPCLSSEQTNIILDTLALWTPLLFFVLLIIWGEARQEWLIHVAAIIVGIVAVVSLWGQILSMQAAIILVCCVVALRAIEIGKEKPLTDL